ncbi:hypothetical protein L204_105889 [Cryptococcus depauperatus]
MQVASLPQSCPQSSRRTDMILAMNDPYMQQIIDGTKTYEFRKYNMVGIKRIWFYRTAPHSAVTHVCEVEPAVTRNPGDEPLPVDGLGNKEFNNRHADWVSYDFAYRINSVYESLSTFVLTILFGYNYSTPSVAFSLSQFGSVRPGTLSLVVLLADTESAISVLSNAHALNDVSDWVGQLVLEEFLKVPELERNDYISAGKTSAAVNLEWYPNLVKELQARNGISRELETYAGTYWEPSHIFKIVVTVEKGELYWALQGLDSEKFRLTHYEDDVFTWLQPRNELSRRGRWMGSNKGHSLWKVEFKMGDGPDRLFWAHDMGVSAAEFMKE